MMKKFTHGFLAFLFVLVSTTMFAQQQSFAGAQPLFASNAGSTGVKLDAPITGATTHASSDVSQDIQLAVKNTLRASTNAIWFEKNAGQFGTNDVLYGFRTDFGSMAVYNNKLRIISKQRETEEKDEDEEELHMQIMDITFPGSANNWTVEPGSKSAVLGTYYRGTDRSEKPIAPNMYNEITLKNVYPGIDLRLYSGQQGSLEFDWLVSKASDYARIKMNINGQDGIKIGADGNMTLKLRLEDMKMVTPETFQIVNGEKRAFKTKMIKIDDHTVSYKVEGDINPNMPLVIDPVMMWSTYMHNGSGSFDEYLYSIASNSAGEVFCAGFTNEAMSQSYLSNVAAGYSNTYSTSPSTVLYKLNSTGTAILAWTMTGVTGSTNWPSDLDLFPDGRVLLVYTEDVVQIFSSTLAARPYSGSINTANAGNANHGVYQSVCVIDNTTFYVSGTASSAYPTSIIPANAPDPTFAGSSEGVILRVTGANTASLTAAWGTYVGGNNSEVFTSIAVSIDRTKIAFATHTVVGSAYPSLVNAVDNTIAGTSELLVGVLPVSSTPQTAFSVFSYLGGSSSEGTSGGTYASDKAVVCADNTYFYVGGNTSSGDLPGTSGSVQSSNGGGIDQFISRIPFNGSAGSGFKSTYSGGSSDDIVGGIAVDFRSSDVLLFGTTNSGNYPVNNTTPASPYYQANIGGAIDISYTSVKNDLTGRTYGTYIGGTINDYMGSTGVLRGTGHLFYNNTNGLVYIGTTIHSDQSTVPHQWITDVPGFDKSIPTQTSSKDNHFIFEWNSNTFDYGDAPSTYDAGTAAHSALSDKLRLGLTIDAETTPLSSATANGDDVSNTGTPDDEDGVAVIPGWTVGATTYSVSVSVFNNTGLPITLRGWVDANNNGVFDAAESASLSIPTSTSQQTVTLSFSGLTPVVYGTGKTFLRIRMADAALSSTDATGEIGAGEVEDYQICIKPDAGADKTVCLVGTATMSATGTGTWTAQAGNPGTATITTPSSPTTTIGSFSAVGTYHFIWTNSTGCTDTANVIVTTQPGAVTITPSSANICVGSSTVLTASSSPSGGTYQWSPLVAMTPSNGVGAAVTVNPTSTQLYTVVYTLGGCNSSSNRTVTVYPVVTADAGVDQTYCSNVSTTVTLGGSPTAAGGSGNFTYAWSPPTRLSATNVANPTITSIIASTTTYYVTVTDNITGCTSVDSMKLTINPSVTVSIALSDTDLCLGQFTSLAATGVPAGGSYTWTPTVGMTPPAGNVATVSVAPSANQTYTVVYSLAGCTNSASRGVNVYPNVSAKAGADQTYCLPVGSTITLGGSPTANGGSGNFTYAWSPSTRLSSTTVANPTITAVASNITYYVTVTDTKSGCSSVDSMVLIINSQATVSISSPDTSLCSGQSATLTATGLPAGGTYQWSPTSFMTPAAGNTATVVVAPAANQTYQVTYTTSGCSGTAAKTVNVVPAVTAHSGGDQTYCMPYASTITLGGSPTATGGSGNFSYNWSPTTRLSNATAANPTLTSNVASTIKYFVTVTDNVSGCTSVDSMTLTLNPAVVANAGAATSTCAGTGVVIGGSPTGSGGTGALTYSWTPTGGLSASNVPNPTATPAILTTYTVVVTDTKTCSASSSVQVSVSAVPTANAGPPQTLTDCSAASVNIGGSPTASGGAGGYTYSWSPVGGLDFSNISNPNVSHIASNTTYTVTVTDSKGCTATSSTTVNVTTSTMQIDAGVNASYCANSGGTATFTGTLTGGSGPFTYAWTPTTGLTPSNAISTVANPSAAGVYIYTLNVTDINGCNASDTVRLDVWPVVVANAGPGVAVCSGFGAAIGGSPTASGGSGSFVYSWSPATGLNSTSIANPTATPASSTPYSVTVTDLHSCSATSSVFVTVNSNPVAHAGLDQSYCIPVTSTVTLGATPTATGGSGTYSYLWSPSTNLSSTTAAHPTVTIAGATNLTYQLVVTDVATGCTNLDSTHLTILAQPSVSISSVDTDLCTGQTATLTASGSPGGGTYQWAPLFFIVPGAGNTASVDVTPPTGNQTYQVVYTQGTCSDTAYKTVRVLTPVRASAGPDQTFCLPVGSTITIGGNPTASSGSGIYRYNWSPSTNLNSTTVANPTLTTNTAGTTVYTVTVTDTVTGCTDISSMTLVINPTATVTVALGDTDICSGQNTTLTAIGVPAGGTYQWSPTFNMNPGLGNTATVIVAPSGTQRYEVTYSVNGCSGSTAVTVNVFTPVVAHAGIDQSICLPYAANVFLGSSSAATGGSGNYSYHWSPATNLSDSTAPNPIVTKVNTNTEYYLTVTDNVTGCYSIDSSHLFIDTHATLSIAATDTNLCFGQCATLTAVVSPAGGSYQWVPVVYLNPGTGNTQSVNVCPISNQNYQLVYTRNGCRDTAYQNINVYPVVVAHSGGDQTYCLPIAGNVTLGAVSTATGGSGNYTYAWYPNINLNDTTSSNPTLDSVVAGTRKYYVLVTDAVTGCSSLDSMVLNIQPQAFVSISSPKTDICLSESAFLTATGTPAGGNYQWNPIIAMTPADGNSASVSVAPASSSQTYFVYYDLNGCKDTASIVVRTYTQPVVNAGPDQSFCLPATGIVRVGNVATGGSGSYSYQWTPSTYVSDSTAARPRVDSINTAGSTTYTVLVTDLVTGCTAMDSAVITLTTSPHIVITSPDTNLCVGQSTTLTATATPGGGSYHWSPGVAMTPVNGNGPTVTVAPTSTQAYIVTYGSVSTVVTSDGDTIVLATGCNDTAYQTINVYPLVSAHAGGNQSFCLPVSGTVTLGATPSATGGSTHYLYTWSPSTNLSDSTAANPIVTDTAAFNIVYHLTVTDSVSGCSAMDSARIIVSPGATVTISSADTDLCAGQNTTLTAVGLPAGGTYQWAPALFMTPAAGTTASVSVAPPSTVSYTVTYTLANCSSTATKVVNVYTSPVANAGPDKSFCPPTTVVQIGQIATGGSGSYTYLWASRPAGFTSTVATPLVSPGASSTTYYVTVTDAVSGCTSTDSVIVIKHSSPPVDAGQDKGICTGSSTQLIATGALTYQWAPSGAGMTPSNGSSPIVTVAPVSTTTYSVTGTDVYGCTASDTVQVSITPNLVVHVRPVTLCDHDTAFLIPNLQGSNYRYQWTPGTGLTCVTCATPSASPPPGNNVYTVTITDSITGCIGSDTVSVVVHRLPNAQFRADVSCYGDSTHFTDLSTSTDPIASWYYNFGDTATYGDTSNLRNPEYLYKPYSAAGYDAYQMVTTIYGCSDTAHALVNTLAPIVTTAGPDTVIGFGNSVVLGATGGTSYAWSPAAGLSSTNIANPVATPLLTTTYYVTVSLGACSSIDSVTIVVARLPDVTAGPDTFVCAGNPIVLQGFSKTAGATYQWLSPGAVVLDSPNIAQPIAVSQFPGVYMEILKVTYFTQGVYVSAYDTMFLTVNPIPVITPTPDSVSVCSGTPYGVNFNSSLPSTTFTWTGDNGTSGTGNIPVTTIINNGTKDSIVHYTIVGVVPGGCTDTVIVPVIVKPIPTLTLSSTPAEQCSGTNYVATVTSNIPSAVITWQTTLGPNGTGGNVNQVLNNPGNTPITVVFTYRATYNGCTSPDFYDTVVVNPLPHADAGPDMTTPACSTDSILIGGSPTGSLGTPGYTYSWTPTAGITGYTTAANPYVQHLGANTTYTVTVTDSKGCTASDQMSVTVTPPSLAITLSVNGTTTYCEGSGSSVDFTVNVTGGAAPYNYLWSPSAFLSDTFSQVVTASPDVAGSYPYTVVVTDNVGCQASKTRVITVKPLPHPAITGLDTAYCASVASVPLTASIPGGVFTGAGVVPVAGGYQFRPASIGAGTYVIVYTLTVNGCTHDTSQIVRVVPNATVSISGNSPSYCTLDMPTTFTGTPAGGTWSGPGINPATGLFDPSLITVPNNISTVVTIRYRASNTSGCGDSASINITIYKSLQMTITASADTTCQGGSVVLTPHYPFVPLVNNIQWFDVNGTFITNSLNAITVRPTRVNHGYYAVISSLQGCVSNDTISIHVNQSPVANDDYDSTCLNTPFTFDVTANDTDPENNGSIVRILHVNYGTASVVTNNVLYTPVYGYHGLDTITYQVCNVSCSSDCDTAQAFLYICPQNLPPTADTIRYTAFQNDPHDVNVLLATSDPNGDPLTISVVGTYDPSLTVTQTSNGAYTVTGTTVGTYPIVYQVCDTDQYTVHVLCDTAVIFANIIPVNNLVNHPPVANNDYATTTGIQPATVNVRGNDTDPDGNPLSLPSLSSNSTTPHGRFSVNSDGTVTFQPNGGLAQGIYYDTVSYCIYDITTIAPQPLQSCAILVVTTNVIDVVSNRPPVAVDDHVTVAQNTPVMVNVKGNDSDPDGDPLGTPTVLTSTTSGTITTVSSNGNVTYVPNFGVHSVNGQPVDSFLYSVCDTLALHGPSPLCDTAEVYIYLTPANLPPTADTVRFVRYINTPIDLNVLLAVSDPNGDPMTISLVGSYDPSLTVAHTGNGAYTVTGAAVGTYPIVYQVCDTDRYPVHVLCDTSVILATIVSDSTIQYPPSANNDYATIDPDSAVVNVRGNDYSDPVPHGLTLPVLVTSTTTADGTWHVDANGNVVFNLSPTPPTYVYADSIQYQVCDLVNGLCSRAWAIVTTNLVDTPVANRPPLAVDDHLTVAENSTGTVVNVKANDSDPDGNPLGTPAIIVGTVNGTIDSVATNGDVTYTPVPYLHSINGQPVDSFKYVICDTLSAHGPSPLCDTAEAYINVAAFNLPPVANNIYLNTTEDHPIGVNVASGAFDPNGDPLTYTYPDGSSTTQGGTVVITGNGSVNYFPPVGFIGVDSFAYSVCDLSPYPVTSLCDTAYVVINVTNPADTLVNHPPVATDDHTVAAPGGAININVIANDSDPDGNPINVTVVTPVSTALGGTVSIGLNNTVNYTAPTTLPDSIVVDTFSYVLCDTSVHPVTKLCDTAFVYITINKFDTNIIHINRAPVAADDYSTICEEEYSIVNVLSNDIDPNGDILSVRSIITPPTHGIAAVSSPSIVYIPALNFFGQDSLEYRVCDNGNPSLCDTAWVHYTVNLINHRPLAEQDTTSTYMNTSVNVSVTTNDFEPDNDSTTLAIVTPPIHGTALQVGNSYVYTPDAGYAGDDTFYYRVCDVQNPTAVYCATYTQQCDVGMVSIHILHHPPHVPPTYDTIPQNSPPVTICPLVSDTDHNSVHVTSFPCGPFHGTVGFATSDSCLTYVPAVDYVGNDSFCVVYCDNIVPSLCDTDKVYITVTPVCIPPVAVVDSYSVFHLLPNATLNVTANDTNHTTSALIVSIVTQPATLGIVAVSGTTIRFTPNTAVGQDQFLYSICSVNPACTTCDTAIVYLNVTGTPNTPPVAVNDSARIPQDSSVCVRVITNDRPGTNPITLTSACVPAHGTNSIAPNGYICYVPTHGFFGTDSFCYTICDNSAPALCSTATVYVVVTPNPHPPVAVNDTATTAQGTPVVICVGNNDSDPDGNLNIGSVSLASIPGPGNVTNISAVTGCITFVPDSTFLGVSSFQYSICDSTPAILGGPLCSTATVYINITPLNHPPHAPDTTVTVPEDSVILVCPLFSDPDAGQSVAVASVCTPSHGTAVIAGPTCVNYTPSPLFYGTDSFCYVVCDNGIPALCDTGIVTIVVTHVPHCPIAIKDFLNAQDTVPVVINELVNDLDVGTIGSGYSVTIVSGPTAGNTAVVNANGTITYTAAAGFSGIDVINYRVTDSLDSCSSVAAITIFVGNACVGPIAADDIRTVCGGSILSADVLGNDYLGNTGYDTLIVTGTGSHGFAYVNTSTHQIDYVPAILYHGPDTVTYQVCNVCPSGTNCDTGILAINVLITNHAPVAVDDTATMIEDHSDTINVVANDYDVDGDPLTVSISAQPTYGTLTLYNNQLVYTPFPDYCGTDTFGYQVTGLNGSPLCPGQRAWDLGLVFVNITCVNDTPVIPDTLVHVPEDSIITVCVPFTDPDKGDVHTATVLCAPLHGVLVSTSTASDTPAVVCQTYKPDSNFYGVDSICVILCDNGTPALCDTSHIVIIVDPRNEPPVVQDQYVTTPKGQPIGVNISTGAYDPNGDPLSYSYPSGTGPQHGTWTPDAHNNGTGVYVSTDPTCPPVGGTCSDSFTVVVCDNSPNFVHVLCDTATVFVTIYDTTNTPNHPPVANTDYAVTDTIRPVIVYVAANDLDPDGDALTVPTIVSGPGHGTLGYNALNQLVYTPAGPFASALTADSFTYSICDTLSAHNPQPLCDTATAYITIDYLDSPSIHTNLPPVAVDDNVNSQYGATVVIPVLHNDSDPNGDPIHVTTVILTPVDSAPHGGTATVNADGTITYSPFTGPGRGPNANDPDTFYYVICDTSAYLPVSLCDTARVIVRVPNSVQGVNDTTLTGSSVAVTVNVKANDYDPELDSFYVVGTVTGPSHGTAILTDTVRGIYTYTPDGTTCSVTGAIVDSFSYAVRDTLGAMDTATVYIRVKCCSVVAADDTFNIYQGDTLTAGILINDGLDPSIPHHIAFSNTANVHGTLTVRGDSVIYAPDSGYCGTAYFEYVVSDTCGRDTANVNIHITCANINPPVLVNDTIGICIGTTDTLINVLANDYDIDSNIIAIDTFTQGSHGTVALQTGALHYTPTAGYVGTDTFTYKACDNGVPVLCSTASVFIDIHKCSPPIIVDTLVRDTVLACSDTNHICIDSIYQGAGYTLHFAGICDSTHHGVIFVDTTVTTTGSYGTLCFSYIPNCDTSAGGTGYVGNDTACLIICNTGVDTSCTTVHVIITVLPKPPVDSVWANDDVAYTCDAIDTLMVLANDGFAPNPGNPLTGTAIHIVTAGANAGLAPHLGTISVVDSTILYTPNPTSDPGTDTFQYVIADNGNPQQFDTATVIVYVCQIPTPKAVDDNSSCMDTTSLVNTPGTINVLANDTLFFASDTTVTVVVAPAHGHAVVNADFTVTYTPDSGFHGNDNLEYSVCESVGPLTSCDTASVCINVIDTVTPCFFPNGFSPNGDNINDKFVFPCSTNYPNATLRVYNRWGDAVWLSSGGYKNDWDGTNQSGTPLPDGTYYFIYQYNDGSGKSEARFVVVHRGEK